MKKYKVISFCLDDNEGPMQKEEIVEASEISFLGNSLVFRAYEKPKYPDSISTINTVAIYPAMFTTVKLTQG